MYGDFDRDGVLNVDDKRPFVVGKKDNIHPEMKLSTELKKLEKVENDNLLLFNDVKKDFPELSNGRVKHPISILKKLNDKFAKNITDFVGTTIVVDNRNEVHEKARELMQKHKVIDDENHYSQPKGEVYYARHLIISYKERPVEIRIMSKPFYKLFSSKEMHYLYKNEMYDEMKRKYKDYTRTLFERGY